MAYTTLKSLFQKDTAEYKLVFKNKTDDSAIDITGWIIDFYLKENANTDDSSAYVHKQITSFTNPELGIAYIQLTSDDTNRSGNFAYKFVATDVNLNRKTYIAGTIAILKA